MAKGTIFNRMLAIGVGLIGGSICLAAKKKGLAGHVLGYSRKLETAHEALKLGIVDECIAGPGDSNVRNVDVVVLSIPVRQYKQVLTQFLPSLPPNCLIFDAGSTKSDVAVMLDELEPQFPGLKSRFVLAHPIAGGESHGPAIGAMERSIGHKETQELAVMVDTFRPLMLTEAAMKIDDGKYYQSWLEK